MAIKPIIENLDDAPEALRGAYTEKEGKFYLDIDGMSHNEEWTGLQTSYNQIKSEKKQIEKQFKMYKSLGKAPDELQELIAEYDALKAAGGNTDDIAEKIKNSTEAVKAQLSKQYGAEIETLKNEVNTFRSKERSLNIRSAINDGIGTDGIPEILVPLLQARMGTDDEGSVFIMGDDGQPMHSKDGYMTVKEYVQSLRVKPEYKGCFKSSQGAGGGSPAQGSTQNNASNTGGVILISISDPEYVAKMAKYGHLIKTGKAKVVD